MDRSSLGDRMKKYEEIVNVVLMGRVPVAIRVDGKNFSRLTKRLGLGKPFDWSFRRLLDDVMLTMCAEIQGCVLGYGQSDEISFIVRNDQSLDTQPYFGNRVQKMASISAGMASALFTSRLGSMDAFQGEYGIFDARAYALPDLTEAGNYLVWRQQDCTRNSISSAAYYGVGAKVGRKTARKMIHGLKSKELQELMFQEAEINWNDFLPEFKRGSVAFKEPVEVETPNGVAVRMKWRSGPAPIFSSEESGRKWLYAPERLGRKDEKQEADPGSSEA